MKIHLASSKYLNRIRSYLTFNLIDFEEIELWNANEDHPKMFDVPTNLLSGDNTAMVIGTDVLVEMIKNRVSRENLAAYINNGNHVLADMEPWDSFVQLNSHGHSDADFIEHVRDLDRGITDGGSLTILIEARPIGGHWLNSLKRIRVIDFPHTPHCGLAGIPRIQGASVDKIDPKFDFMMTTLYKDMVQTPHRKLLWDELNLRPTLIERGSLSYRNMTDDAYKDGWVGQQSPTHGWHDSHPSMDLYQNSWLELVPETLYDDGFMFTEKSIKPIATKTPFLTLSTPGYLGYLRGMGFRTFDGLIDESYDLESDLRSRVKSIVDILEDIITFGAREFYEASIDILDHNHLVLAQLNGINEYENDLVIRQWLDDVDR